MDGVAHFWTSGVGSYLEYTWKYHRCMCRSIKVKEERLNIFTFENKCAISLCFAIGVSFVRFGWSKILIFVQESPTVLSNSGSTSSLLRLEKYLHCTDRQTYLDRFRIWLWSRICIFYRTSDITFGDAAYVMKKRI